MLNRTIKILSLFTLALLIVGCVRAKQQTTVNPDASGMMQLTFSVSEQNAEQMGEMPFTNLTQEDIQQLEENGFVAFSKPKETTENGYKTVTITGYFTDINDVKFDMGEGDPGQKPVTFSMEEGQLTVSNTMLMQMASDAANEEMPEEQKPMMRAMLEGMEITETYDVPGDITSAGPYEVKDGQAMAKVTVDDLMNNSPALQKLAGNESVVIGYDAKDWDADAKQKFQQELQQAKAEWAETKAEAKSGDEMEEGMEMEVEEVEVEME